MTRRLFHIYFRVYTCIKYFFFASYFCVVHLLSLVFKIHVACIPIFFDIWLDIIEYDVRCFFFVFLLLIGQRFVTILLVPLYVLILSLAHYYYNMFFAPSHLVLTWDHSLLIYYFFTNEPFFWSCELYTQVEWAWWEYVTEDWFVCLCFRCTITGEAACYWTYRAAVFIISV